MDFSKHLKNVPIVAQTKNIATKYVFPGGYVFGGRFHKESKHALTCQNASICATRVHFVFGTLFLMRLDKNTNQYIQSVETFNN